MATYVATTKYSSIQPLNFFSSTPDAERWSKIQYSSVHFVWGLRDGGQNLVLQNFILELWLGIAVPFSSTPVMVAGRGGGDSSSPV